MHMARSVRRSEHRGTTVCCREELQAPALSPLQVISYQEWPGDAGGKADVLRASNWKRSSSARLVDFGDTVLRKHCGTGLWTCSGGALMGQTCCGGCGGQRRGSQGRKVSRRQRAAEAPSTRVLGQVLVAGRSGAAAVVCPARQCSLQFLRLGRLCADGAAAQCGLSRDRDAGIEPAFLSGLPLCKPVSSLRQPCSAALPGACARLCFLARCRVIGLSSRVCLTWATFVVH
ncbi:uncharacterized protein LOC112966343 isoform X2 [Apteryx rowi]|uniref:uncharacterized protein LOC112966343 isoform X2 n=1 Tax=Apteryx rowi TaxID=308060 RepID=UPI000E1C441E|nr:uncharacterized protein LOC112966343 isoform X2 [Apteryx rowi]